jgi:type IX secretion system PorP/SprF family membrane protein
MLGIQFNGIAQDIQFSQFYNNPLVLNPAFAGSTHQTRGILHQRLQWMGLDAQFRTSSISLDHFFAKQKSGIGLLLLHDVQGQSYISNSTIQLNYAYELSISKKLSLRAGINAAYQSRSLNYQVLSFPDQYNNSGLVSTTSAENNIQNKKNILDINTGLLLYSNHFWISLAVDHITQPNTSFLNEKNNLPIKTGIAGGYRFSLTQDSKAKRWLIPTFYYKSQGKSDQLDIGTYLLYDSWMTGVWYRGIPFKKYDQMQNNESMVVLLGYKYKSWSLAYSYDITVSTLNNARSGGSHEISLTYLHTFSKQQNKKILKKIPCPEFD